MKISQDLKRLHQILDKYIGKRTVYLLLWTATRINSKMDFMHKSLNHTDSVRAISFRINGLLHNNCCNIPKLIRKLRFPLFPSNLKLSFVQNLQSESIISLTVKYNVLKISIQFTNLQTDFALIISTEGVNQIFRLGKNSFRNIWINSLWLQHFIQIFLPILIRNLLKHLRWIKKKQSIKERKKTELREITRRNAKRGLCSCSKQFRSESHASWDERRPRSSISFALSAVVSSTFFFNLLFSETINFVFLFLKRPILIYSSLYFFIKYEK